MTGVVILILRISMLFVLYGFLGWGILTLWRDLQHSKKVVEESKSTPIFILCKWDETVKEYSFSLPEIFIGRDPACDIVLDDATISARHIRLFFLKGHWWVEDLNSTNGTIINGELIKMPVVITDQDTILCGQAHLTIRS